MDLNFSFVIYWHQLKEERLQSFAKNIGKIAQVKKKL